MADVQIYRYRNDGSYNDTLDYYEGTHEEGIDGTDRLILKCKEMPRKYAKLVWRDELGTWREHMVSSTVREHVGRRPRTTVTCCNSIDELYRVQAEGSVLKGTVEGILTKLLANTRWTAGNCDAFADDEDGDDKFELEVWHKNVRECISELVDMCGGELVTAITVGDFGVSRRTARIVEERGSGTAQRQFTYGKNMEKIKRTVSNDEVYTAVVGYGKKLLEIELEKKDPDDMTDEERDSYNKQVEKAREDPYLERLSVAVKSKADIDKWGSPGPDGQMGHSWMTYTDDACSDKAFLKRQCKKLIKEFSKLPVSYEFDIYQVGDDSWRYTKLGSPVHIVDESMGLDAIERISYVKRNLKGRDSCRIVIGKRVNPLVDKFKADEKKEKKATGNTSRVASSRAVTTKNNYAQSASRSYTPQSYTPSGGYSGGFQSYGGATTDDRWIHQVDGVTQAIGTINFVTTPSNSGSSGSSSSSSGSSDSSSSGWGGGDGDNPSSSGGGDF